MDENIYVVIPFSNPSPLLEEMVKNCVKHFPQVVKVTEVEGLTLQNKKLLFVLELNGLGYDISILNLFSKLKALGNEVLKGSIGALLIHSSTELGTKRAAQDIVMLANSLGCSFIGHPLVESTASLSNFLTWQKTLDLSLEEICMEMCSRLGERLYEYKKTNFENPSITVLFSTPHKTSNTLDLWHMVSKHLKSYDIKELQIENGKVQDCKGCSYKLCIHYGLHNSCFYGGTMIEDVLPAIENSEIIVWLCPNYNDSIAANLTAVINRLTVLYHKMSFHHKHIYSIVVSGNSGSDSVAKQLLGALNINKGFHLPAYFSLMATANDPGAIFSVENIDNVAENFANCIKNNF